MLLHQPMSFKSTQTGRVSASTKISPQNATVQKKNETNGPNNYEPQRITKHQLTGRSLRDPMLKQRRMLPTSACTTTAFLAFVFQSRQYPRHWLMVSMVQEDTCSSSRRDDISVVVSETRQRKIAVWERLR